ncbi:hypothetical protein [Kibdelosporangium philippinense]
MAPNRVRRTGTVSRDRVRSTIMVNRSSIRPPHWNSRLRLYST